MDTVILNALYQWARSHPYPAGIIAGLWLAGVVWRGMPEADRKALEVRYPRPVGLLRAVLGILPDPWAFVRALGYSVVAGEPHPDSARDVERAAAMRSLVAKLRDASIENKPPVIDLEREPISEPPKGEPGYVDLVALRQFAFIVVCIAAAVIVPLCSCASFSPQFRMVDPEIVQDPKFGECARTGTTLAAGHTQFAMLASVCVQRVGDAGVVIEPEEAPVLKDAGVIGHD